MIVTRIGPCDFKRGSQAIFGHICVTVFMGVCAICHADSKGRQGSTEPFLHGLFLQKEELCSGCELPCATGQLHHPAEFCFRINLLGFLKQRSLNTAVVGFPCVGRLVPGLALVSGCLGFSLTICGHRSQTAPLGCSEYSWRELGPPSAPRP